MHFFKGDAMQQLELFDEEGPQPIQRWLHVWSEAERERRIKKVLTLGCEPCGLESPPERAEETVENVALERITRSFYYVMDAKHPTRNNRQVPLPLKNLDQPRHEQCEVECRSSHRTIWLFLTTRLYGE